MATKEEVFEKLREVLNTIQETSDFERIEITTMTCPVRDMPQFDSQLWVTAITMLGEELGVVIPDNVNIFLSEDGKRRLKMGEIVEKVLSKAKK